MLGAHLPQFSVAVQGRKLLLTAHRRKEREAQRGPMEGGGGEMHGVLLVGSRGGRVGAGAGPVGKEQH